MNAAQKSVIVTDTPGLDDVYSMKQAAAEIEKGLRLTKVFKINFVITLEMGRIRSQDIATMNLVCDAIDIDFKYGIIINKLSNVGFAALTKNVLTFSLLERQLRKQPSWFLLLKFEIGAFEEANVLLSEESRSRLRVFIDAQPGNFREQDFITHIRATDAKERENLLDNLTKELAHLQILQQRYVMEYNAVNAEVEKQDVRFKDSMATQLRFLSQRKDKDAKLIAAVQKKINQLQEQMKYSTGPRVCRFM